MRFCAFSPHLGSYQGPDEPLRAHLARCEACQVVALARAASTEKDAEPTPSCPEPVKLAAYRSDFLDAAEQRIVAEHVSTCAYCQQTIREVEESEGLGPDAVEILKVADRELQGYLLAKEIAEWLCKNKFPQETETVQETFDITFDAVAAQHEKAGRLEAVSALGFTGAVPSRASLIAALSSVAGRMRAGGADVSAIDAQARSLLGQGVDAHLRREFLTGLSEALRSTHGHGA